MPETDRAIGELTGKIGALTTAVLTSRDETRTDIASLRDDMSEAHSRLYDKIEETNSNLKQVVLAHAQLSRVGDEHKNTDDSRFGLMWKILIGLGFAGGSLEAGTQIFGG